MDAVERERLDERLAELEARRRRLVATLEDNTMNAVWLRRDRRETDMINARLRAAPRPTRVERVTINKDDFSELPVAVQSFFMLAGHIANEPMVFERLALLIIKDEEEVMVEQARAAWFVILVKVVAGKLEEAWQATNKSFFNAQVSRIDWVRNASVIQDPLAGMKAYFSGKNVIHFLRNQASFHYTAPDTAQQLSEYEQDDELELFLSDSTTNTLYLVSEAMILTEFLAYCETDDYRAAFHELMGEVLACTRDVRRFMNGFISTTLDHLGDVTGTSITHHGGIYVDDEPTIDDFKLPIFITTKH